MPDYPKEPIVAAVGDEIACPGCGEQIVLDGQDGWRNGRGYTCKPPWSTHSQHIETMEVTP